MRNNKFEAIAFVNSKQLSVVGIQVYSTINYSPFTVECDISINKKRSSLVTEKVAPSNGQTIWNVMFPKKIHVSPMSTIAFKVLFYK